MQWSELHIQRILFAWLEQKGHELICPNTGVFGWEADLVSVTSSMYAHEFEIKISRSDFKADAQKILKHKTLISKRRTYPGPSRFFYVVPTGLLDGLDVPEHAGLIEVFPGARPPIIRKPAPLLHSYSITPGQRAYMARGLMLRYWHVIHPKEAF